MFRSIYLIAVAFLGMASVWADALYTDLRVKFCDEKKGIIYNGAGEFSVQSPAESELEVMVDLESLRSYVNSNDYVPGRPFVRWELELKDGRVFALGMADTVAEMQHSTRLPLLTGYWNQSVWQGKVPPVEEQQLREYADEQGRVRLRLAFNPSHGFQMRAFKAGSWHTLYQAPDLRTSLAVSTRSYQVNTNYVCGVQLHTPSTLNTAGYDAPQDYTKPFLRRAKESIGRVMFCGDSITHGVCDQTWRWQLFKTLVDNGVEYEIVGPREGYTPAYTRMNTSDAGNSYAGCLFPNLHLAQSSGRTHNIISGSAAGSGVNYGGHSTSSAAASFNCDTFVCLMGTNDLLSDRGYNNDDFSAKMQKLLGGKVSHTERGYSRTPDGSWGTMGKIAEDLLRDKGDVLYILSVPTWGFHSNNNEPERHVAVEQYNRLLSRWVEGFARSTGKNVRYVESNTGLVDLAAETPFMGHDDFFRKRGVDGLHPGEQGSIIIAGNLEKAMGLGGRTAGLPRASRKADFWRQVKLPRSQKVGDKARRLGNIRFSPGQGASVEFRCSVGDGARGGWLSPGKRALHISVADGAQSGTLTVDEAHISWGKKVLYCRDASALHSSSIRIVLHAGDAGKNIPGGFYVWLDKTLIGQGLPATPAEGKNGIYASATGASCTIHRLYAANASYAP